MLAQLAAALLASADAGLPPAVYADRAELELDLPDGGLMRFSGECFPDSDGGTSCGGGWLPTPRLEAHGGEVARLRTQVQTLSATPPLFSAQTWAFFSVLMAVLFAAGLVGGFELRGLLGR